ncbi:MAG: hypothetical protein WC518_04445 [Patescibacteria group bacterium]
MKKIFFLIIIFIVLTSLIWAGVVLAVSESRGSSVNINATIPTSGGPPGCPPNCPPKPDSLVIDQISAVGFCTSATVNWHTYLSPSGKVAKSTGVVSYWPSGHPEEKATVSSTVPSEFHSVNLNDLEPLTAYDYDITATAAIGGASSGTLNFTTTCGIINASIVAEPEERGVKIIVSYPDDPDISKVIIRKKINSVPLDQSDGVEFYYDAQPHPPLSSELFFDPHLAGDPGQRDYDNFSNLNDNYCYAVFICNSHNNCSSGSYDCARRAIPEADGLMAVPGNGRIELLWSNPGDNSASDFIFSKTRLIKTGENCLAADPTGGVLLREGEATGYLDGALENNQTYYYKLFVKNSYGEYSDGLCLRAVPSAQAQARCISGVRLQNGDKKIEATWINPENEAGVFELDSVQWQRDSSCVVSAGSGQTIYSGLGNSFSDTNVNNGSLYAYSSFVNYNNDSTASCGCFYGLPATETELPEEVCPECSLSLQRPSFKFYVNSGALELLANQNKLDLLAGYDFSIIADQRALPKPVSLMVAQLQGKNYFFSLNNLQQSYQASLATPFKEGSYSLQITTVYQDKTKSVETWYLMIWPRGVILDEIGRPIKGATVSLWADNGSLSAGLGFANPQSTDTFGSYGLMVASGKYYLEVEYRGYQKERLAVEIKNNIVNANFRLIKIKSFLEQVVGSLSNLLPPARQANNYIAPGIMLMALINTAAAVPFWNFVYYLQYLFTEPLAWLFRRRRQGWGVVFNSITKKPVDLAVVRLYDRQAGRLLRSRVTDKEGRYSFLVGQGVYYLEVIKAGFVFPSNILKGVNEDRSYTDIYHGQNIEIRDDQKGIIIANIPLDQEELKITDKQVISRDFWRKVKENISVVSPILAIISFAVSPTILIGSFTILHLILYLFFRRLAKTRQAKPWGVIYNKDNKKSLAKSVVRIIAPEYNRMLEAQVTDNYGRYGFLVDNNIYYVTANKDGYREKKSDEINLVGKKSSEVVGQDLSLEPVSGKGAVDFGVGSETEKTTATEVLASPQAAGGQDNTAPESKEEAKQPDEIVAAAVSEVKSENKEVIKEDYRG